MSNVLAGAIEALQSLVQGGTDEFAALDQILDSCVSALESEGLIDNCFDIVEAAEQLVERGIDAGLVDVADDLSQLSRSTQYGEFPEDHLESARRAVETLIFRLEEFLEQEQPE